MQKIHETRHKIEKFCAESGKYAPDAYEFVTNCVIAQVNALTSARHLSAQELLQGLVQQLEEDFGFLTASILEYWQIKTASDIGEIVFDLIELKILSASEDDKRSDFDIDFPLHTVSSAYQTRKSNAKLEIPQID